MKKKIKKQKESPLHSKLPEVHVLLMSSVVTPQNGVKHSENVCTLNVCNVYHRLEFWDGYSHNKIMFCKPSSLTRVGYTP